MTLLELTKTMLAYNLSKDPSTLQTLTQDISSRQNYYLIAAKNTSANSWANRRFALYVDENKALPVFVDAAEASAYASFNGCTINGQVLVTKSSQEQFLKTVAEYSASNLIQAIKFYSRPPLFLLLDPNVFALPDAKQSEPVALPTIVGIDIIRQVLETYDTTSRRKLDPGARYENSHTLLESLIQQNNLDCSDIDKKLNLPAGYTYNYIVDIKGSNPSIEVLTKYLAFFGLQEYLYIYKKDSQALIEYLRDHKRIDVYKVTKSVSPMDERFKLEHVQKGTDKKTGANVYNLTLSSKNRTIHAVVSNRLGLVESREYKVDGLDIINEKHRNRASDLVPMPDDDALAQMMADLSKPSDKQNHTQRDYYSKRHDDIIGYFRKGGLDGKSAEAKYRDLETVPSVLDEFYKYTQSGQMRCTPIEGYTVQKLTNSLGYTPFEAYYMLARLKVDTSAAKQELKYRETEPQWGKSVPSKEN